MSQADGSSEQGRAPSGRRRGRRRGLEVRPGSVKQARMEAGLSLGQVAQGDISRTAIYFVETAEAVAVLGIFHTAQDNPRRLNERLPAQ